MMDFGEEFSAQFTANVYAHVDFLQTLHMYAMIENKLNQAETS